jgi:hypothetical protein
VIELDTGLRSIELHAWLQPLYVIADLGCGADECRRMSIQQKSGRLAYHDLSINIQ